MLRGAGELPCETAHDGLGIAIAGPRRVELRG